MKPTSKEIKSQIRPCFSCKHFNRYTGDICYSPAGDLLAGKKQYPKECSNHEC